MLTFPSYAIKCMETLKQNGFEAYFVGGCVRDAILDRKFDDVDITTNALPEQVISLFEHTIPTGINHGTITVIIDKNNIEVTTYRNEGSYSDSRHPDCVNYVSNLSDDLSRRDFTVNALAYDPQIGLVDLHNGISDIKAKKIRAVGLPTERFSEDALRILRAFRFAATLDFIIEEETLDAAYKLNKTINKVSGERVLTELTKLSCGKISPEFIEFINLGAFNDFGLYKSDISPLVATEFSKVSCEPTLKCALMISILQHDLNTIKTTLKPSSALLQIINFLDKFPSGSIELSDRKNIKKALKIHSKIHIEAYIKRELIYSKNADKIFETIADIDQKNEPYSLNKLNINGNDLKELGLSGKDIKNALDKALDIVIENPNDNVKEILIKKLFE